MEGRAMTGLPKSIDTLEVAVKTGAIRALRTRSALQREKAALGITIGVEKYPNVRIVTSEAAAALRIASDLDAIANELANETCEVRL
jgi:hypothetical protein